MENEKKLKKNPLSLQLDPNLFDRASDEEKEQIVTRRESVSFMKDAMRRLAKNKMAMACLFVLIIITLIAIFVPMIYPYNYTQQDVTGKYLQPFEYSKKEMARINAGEKVFPHIMGTDNLGRDYCIRVIYGTRISLLVGFISALIVVCIGIIYGSISGYFGGRVDLIMMRIVDIIYSLPDVLIVILLSVAIKDVISNSKNELVVKLGAGMISIFIVFGLLYWVGMARQVRGQILSIKEQEYVLAARAMGAFPTASPSSSSRRRCRSPARSSPSPSSRLWAWASRCRCPRWAASPPTRAAAWFPIPICCFSRRCRSS